MLLLITFIDTGMAKKQDETRHSFYQNRELQNLGTFGMEMTLPMLNTFYFYNLRTFGMKMTLPMLNTFYFYNLGR